MQKLAVFASGSGSNARQLIAYANTHPHFTIALLVTNKAAAGAAILAQEAGIPVLVLEKERFFTGDAYIPVLEAYGIDRLVLAGFLWKLPPVLVQHYPQQIVNIHPALLPKFGGSGMYGLHVHRAVITAGEAESGITIHLVDELYDHGATLFQERCPVLPADTPETLQQKVQVLEHAHYGPVIADWLRSQ